MKIAPEYKVIGVMSGTSLDGVDLAYCTFRQSSSGWEFTLEAADTFDYSEGWRNKLSEAVRLNAEDFQLLDVELGSHIGQLVYNFIKEKNLTVDFICSHGHTVFHQPEKKFTTQIGSGYEIFKATQIPVYGQFRNADVALGGQGAPLVPIGDAHLFSEYAACINLGGISNISYQNNEDRLAFDIGPCNIILNTLAQKLGYAYDPQGELAREGELDLNLLHKFNDLFHQRSSSLSSLGFEWISANYFPLFKNRSDIKTLLQTSTQHISNTIAWALNQHPIQGEVLMTGGGVHNDFLLSLIKMKTNGIWRIKKPDNDIINYKEAIIFGFLGVLKNAEQVNCLASVTGALRDSSGGILYKF